MLNKYAIVIEHPIYFHCVQMLQGDSEVIVQRFRLSCLYL